MGRTSLPRGKFGIFSWLMWRSGFPSMGLRWKEEGKNSRFGTACQREEGWWGGLKLEPSPCSIKTPQRDLCRQRRPVERIPLKSINRQRTHGFHRGALPPPPNKSAEDTRAERTSVWFGSKRKRMLKRTRNKHTLRDRLQLMLVLSSAASSRKKKRYSRVCQETVQW